MVTMRANLATEINNATSISDLNDLEVRSAEACRQHEVDLHVYVHRLVMDWIGRVDIEPGVGILTASVLFAGVEHHDPTETLQHCPVSETSNHAGMINFTVNQRK